MKGNKEGEGKKREGERESENVSRLKTKSERTKLRN